MRAFAQAERFVSELESRKLRAAYVFVGDEAFFRKRFRDAILEHLVPADLRDFSFFEFDLAETDLAEILDRARTPSLMAPFQVFFVRGVKNLFGRGSNEEKLAAIEAYCKNPNPDASWFLLLTTSAFPPTSAAWRCRTRNATSASAKPWASTAASWNWRAWRRARQSVGFRSTVPAAA